MGAGDLGGRAIPLGSISRSEIEAFHSAGRTLFSLGLVRGAEGNLSMLLEGRLLITRTRARLEQIGRPDLVEGSLSGDLPGASSDLDVHRCTYRERGPGAIAHSHPAGTVPEGGGLPGEHGLYVFGPTLDEAVARTVERVRGMSEAG